MQNIDAAMDEETEWWQSVAMLAGWPEWRINPKEESFSVNKKKKTQRKRKTTSRVFNN